MDDISYEQAYAALGRALDAHADRTEGSVPSQACPPRYARAVAAELIQEEQKVPPALKNLSSMILEAVENLIAVDQVDLPHRYVKELRGALAQGDKFLADLTAFRSNTVTMPLSTWARVGALDLEELDEDEEPQESPEPRQPPQWVKDGLAAADAKLAELERDAALKEALEEDAAVDAEREAELLRADVELAQDDDLEQLEKQVWNPGPRYVPTQQEQAEADALGVTPQELLEIKAAERDVALNGPGRYLHLDHSASMTQGPELEAARQKLVGTMAARVEQLAEKSAAMDGTQVAVYTFKDGDTAEMEPVEAMVPNHVMLLDGMSSVTKATVLEEAQAIPAEKLKRGDVIPGSGGVFFIVSSAEQTDDEGTPLVRVVYSNDVEREWFPGTMVTAYRPE